MRTVELSTREIEYKRQRSDFYLSMNMRQRREQVNAGITATSRYVCPNRNHHTSCIKGTEIFRHAGRMPLARYWKVIPSEGSLPSPTERQGDIAPDDGGKSFCCCFRDRQPGSMGLGKNSGRTVITSAMRAVLGQGNWAHPPSCCILSLRMPVGIREVTLR